MAFDALRDVIEGTTTASAIEEYLVILSVSETCRYKNLMCWSSFFLRKRISMAFYEAAGVPERSPVGPMRSQHRTVLYKRRLRYWPLILLVSDSRHLLKDFTSCCPTSQKTPFGFIPGNWPPGDRRRCTSRREGSFDSLGFVKPKLVMLR
jgi:hypothetical protein